MSDLSSKAFAWVACLMLGSAFVAAEEEDAGEKWVSAYSWLQTGERLAEAEQWPLAQGSFIEAHRQMRGIQEEHPEFEPEVLAYRVEKLESMIEETQPKLASGDHEIMVKFLDFIDSYEEGLALRYRNEFVESLNRLDIAKVLLDEIIYEKPEEFRDAVETQYTILHSSIEWIDQQINVKERSRRMAAFVADGVEWGTTEFVEEADLPEEGESILTSAELFPALPAPEQIADLRGTSTAGAAGVKEADAAATGSGSGKESESVGGLPSFRMNSKQKSAVADGEERP